MTDLETILEQLQSLTLLEATELRRRLEQILGVCTDVVSSDLIIWDPIPEDPDPPVHSLILTAAGEKKMSVIKLVRQLTPLGVLDAKAFVESLPRLVRQGLRKSEAERIRYWFLDAGAAVEIRLTAMADPPGPSGKHGDGVGFPNPPFGIVS